MLQIIFQGGFKKLNIDGLRRHIDRAFDDPPEDKLEAVLLSINSPGGSPAQSEFIAEYIEHKYY